MEVKFYPRRSHIVYIGHNPHAQILAVVNFYWSLQPKRSYINVFAQESTGVKQHEQEQK